MKRGIVLATLGILILCMLTFALISMPSHSPAQSESETEQPLTLLVDSTPGNAAPPQKQEPPAQETTGKRSAPVEAGLVTGPDGCVLLGSPDELTYLPDCGLTVMVNWGGIYAFNTESGKLAWYRYTSTGNDRFSQLGRRRAVIWSDGAMRVLDMATGREVWSRNEADLGATHAVGLSPDESRIAVWTGPRVTVYSLAGSEHRLLACEGLRAGPWFSDSKTLLESEVIGEGAQATVKWSIFDTDSGERLSGWEAPNAEGPVSGISARGYMAVFPKASAKDSAVRILDARNGTVVREFHLDEIPPDAAWSSDGRWLAWVSRDLFKVVLADAETGKVEAALSKDGHRFCWLSLAPRVNGLDWVLSQDEANNWHAWPVTPEAEPRKILGSRGIASARYNFTGQPANCIVMSRPLGNQRFTHSVFTIDGLQKVAEWCARDEGEWFADLRVSRNMTRIARSRPATPQKPSWEPEELIFSVFAKDNETPIFSAPGRPLVFSPDGKYVVAQTTRNSVSLYDVDTGLLAQEYHSQHQRAYFWAEFSDDSRRMLTKERSSVEVTDLIEGYPRRALDLQVEDLTGWQFKLSPDGSRALCGGPRKAQLFDADTGGLLRTFEETERFAQPYGAGFWGGLVVRAGDWMGMVSDRFKSAAQVDALFAEHGTRVVTCAAGQVIRVWDMESGNLLRTIHTGLLEKRATNGLINNFVDFSSNGRFAFSYNMSGVGTASLWSLSDGALLRQYRLPNREYGTQGAILLDDASAIFTKEASNLFRWPGILTEGAHTIAEGTGS